MYWIGFLVVMQVKHFYLKEENIMDNIKDNEIFNLAFEEILHYNISDINPNDIVKSHVSKKEALNHYRHHDTIFTFYYKHAEDDYTIIEL